MDMFVFMGIIEDLKEKNQDLKDYKLADIKKIYNKLVIN